MILNHGRWFYEAGYQSVSQPRFILCSYHHVNINGMVVISIRPMAIMDSLAAVGAFIGLSEFVKLFICWVQHPLYVGECAHFPFSIRDNFTAHTFGCNPVSGRSGKILMLLSDPLTIHAPSLIGLSRT